MYASKYFQMANKIIPTAVVDFLNIRTHQMVVMIVMIISNDNNVCKYNKYGLSIFICYCV